jgi:hypothetical protein
MSLRAERISLRGTGVASAVIPAQAGIQTGPRIGVRGDDGPARRPFIRANGRAGVPANHVSNRVFRFLGEQSHKTGFSAFSALSAVNDFVFGVG